MNEFREEQEEVRRGTASWYERIGRDLSEEQLASLDAALIDRDIYASTISRVLKKWGYTVTPGSVSWYRKTRGL